MANKLQPSGLRLKVKRIRKSGLGSGCWFGGKGVIKPEGTSRSDELAFHFRVWLPPRKRATRNEIDYLLIVEHDIWANLTPQGKSPVNGDLLSDKRLRYLIGGCSRAL
jgi:hypothetical protein